MIVIKNPNTGKETTHKSTSIKDTGKKIDRLKSNKAWRQLSHNKRIQYLYKFQKQLEKNKDQLQHLLSSETGKPTWKA